MVTTKGTSLNPNAEVWQDIPTQQNTPAGTENSSWLQTYSSSEMTEGYTDDPSSSSKGYYSDYPDSTCDFIPVPPCSGHDMDQPGLGYLVFDSQGESVTDSEDCKEQAVTEESLRESLKKQLEFCFSRYFLYKSPLGPWWPLLGPSPLGVSKHLPVALRKENLSKDMYLISQMDNDQFVPIWTIACMEDIQALTTDVDLILDVLKASPLVEVDEAGEKVRPNHSRCIIILREVSETTPVEEVEALFRSENCPKMLSAEFAHNSNWYITFQSDMDALKAYRYLREEVKTFQGKPVMARIKAINTFFGKNGFPSMDSGGYQQHTQLQPQFAPPIYMQQVYNPQQQYPVYPVVSPTWNPPIIPQFETPLAPFPNNGFMNGYSSNGVYKATCSSVSGHRSTGRNRNHIKALPRSGDLTPSILAPVTAINGMSSSLDSQDVHASRTLPGSPPQLMSLSFDLKDTSISSRDLHRTGRERRSNHRGMRRKREEENNLKPVLTMEAPPPNFDLEASSFPPLPGCVATVQEETVTDVRLSDVVRGLKVSSKVGTQENDSTQNPKDSDNHSNKLDSGTLVIKPTPLKVQTETQQTSSTVPPVVKEDKTEPTNSKDVISPSTPTASTAASEQTPSTPVQAAPTENPALLAPASEQGQRKLSYAEVCQRPARDPPPAPMPPSPSSPATSASQPLQELKVNTVEEPRPNSKKTSDRAGDKRPSRHPSRAFRGTPGQNRVRSSGMKIQEHQRGKRFSPQQGAKHSGKEQNIPPTSPQ